MPGKKNRPIRVMENEALSGILLIDKPTGKTSFSLVAMLRRLTGVKKIGHTGTLDPLATGVMVMLIGKKFTRLSDALMSQDKEYLAKIHLGITTDSYDSDGQTLSESSIVPTLSAIEEALQLFQGTVLQTPPMFSAKKMNGKKLYELARKGVEVERQPVAVTLNTKLVNYSYPILELRIGCSKGTYIRSIANDLGQHLGCGAHLAGLVRTRSGSFNLKDCWSIEELQKPEFNFAKALRAVP